MTVCYGLRLVAQVVGAPSPRAAARSRWEFARGLCGQHPQLSSLSLARTMPVGGAHHQETAPGQRVVASIGRRKRAASLARLEASGSSTSHNRAPAPSARRGPDRASCFCQPGSLASIPFPRRACPFSALVDTATGSQWVRARSEAGDNPPVWRSRRIRHVSRARQRLSSSFRETEAIPIWSRFTQG